MNGISTPHYNPDWLSDDDLVSGFAARLEEFAFLRDELVHAPREGSAQHYLLVGMRGSGKTTMLKRLAVAIRRDADLRDHLIALSFPEELYQVKNLSDFWWAACEALVDELDRMQQTDAANRLNDVIERNKKAGINPDLLSDAGFKCLLETCAALGLRPVLLVDNLDMVFERIDKTGRKLKDLHAPAYWAMRERLSTTRSPIVIGGSVRLSEPFSDVDKAFYDFFVPMRLGKLSLTETRQVLDRLADARNLPEVKQRLQQRSGRIETLYELTGGNPRALGLIFELLHQGPNSRAVEDFERLMDITTPYYKARFEDLSEQAQVVIHALAVYRVEECLRFGLTAAEIGIHCGLATNTVSAQLDVQEREGLVEKTAAHGRTQYRIGEQLFRLWLQMRGNRRIRQNVIGLTRFLEAMFSLEELQEGMQEHNGMSAMSSARLAFAMARVNEARPLQQGLEAKGTDHLMQHVEKYGGKLNDFLQPGDLGEATYALAHMHEQLRNCRRLGNGEQDALLGSVRLSMAEKQSIVQGLCASAEPKEIAQLRSMLLSERQELLRDGMHEDELGTLYHIRTLDCLPLPALTVQDADAASVMANDNDAFRAMVWRLLGSRHFVSIGDSATANAWLDWGAKYAMGASPTEWANVAATMRCCDRLSQARQALDHAFSLGETSSAWFERGALLAATDGDLEEAALAYRKAMVLDQLENQERLKDVTFGYARELTQERCASLQIEPYAKAVRQALAEGSSSALREALVKLFAGSADIATTLASTDFIEDFLAPILTQNQHATRVLDQLRDLDFAKHARPLLLACEAIVANRADMLTELEPEVQGAARRMFERLTTKKDKPIGQA